MSASQMTAAEGTTGFDSALIALAEGLEGQVLMSQDRCIDGLLDIYNAAPTEVVRQLVIEIMDDIRHLSSVKTEDIKAELEELAAAASVENAFFG